MELNFDEIPNGFLISLKYKSQKINTAEFNGGVNGGVNELLELILLNPGSRVPFLQSKLDISTRTLQRWLKSLVDENRI